MVKEKYLNKIPNIFEKVTIFPDGWIGGDTDDMCFRMRKNKNHTRNCNVISMKNHTYFEYEDGREHRVFNKLVRYLKNNC